MSEHIKDFSKHIEDFRFIIVKGTVEQLKMIIDRSQSKNGVYVKTPFLDMLINSKDVSGFTPLMLSAAMGDQKKVALLVEKGANIYQKNILQDTVLDIAYFSQDKETIKYLSEQGVSKSEYKTNYRYKLSNLLKDIALNNAIFEDKEAANLILDFFKDTGSLNQYHIDHIKEKLDKKDYHIGLLSKDNTISIALICDTTQEMEIVASVDLSKPYVNIQDYSREITYVFDSEGNVETLIGEDDSNEIPT
ncbi:MAG: hypothetical protein K0T99_03775 [Alphaproteobacteria bacterium]|nr:hypothetical protein [Alphaproteobacteria bacterium]